MTSTKDRLLELRSKQKFAVDEGIRNNVDKDDPMDAFWSDLEEIGGEVKALSEVVNDLTINHTNPISDKDWQIVEEKLAEVKRMANRVRGKLKRMDQQIKSNSDDDSVEHRIMRTQHLTLSRSFIDVMKTFNERQQFYREHATTLIKQQLGDGISTLQLDHMLEGQAGAHAQIQTAAKKQNLDKSHLHEVEARHRDIKRLENNIKELHDMWMDMAIIVENQGDMVDRIEFNVSEAKDYTEGAAVYTKKALDNYRAARRKKRICTALLITLGVIIILGIVLGILDALGDL